MSAPERSAAGWNPGSGSASAPRVAVERDDPTEVQSLIERAAAGDRPAAQAFQRRYGRLVYSYPLRAYAMTPDDAGDFYLFAFAGGRIYRRLRGWQARASFRRYLVAVVLDDLLLEWQRGRREVPLVPVAELHGLTDSSPEDMLQSPAAERRVVALLARLGPAKATLLKLLQIEDYDLEPGELRHVARSTGRSIVEVLRRIEALRRKVREREARAWRVEDAAAAVQRWICLLERRRGLITRRLSQAEDTGEAAEELQDELGELERKLAWRREQQEALVEKSRRRKVTAPYRDIADLLGTSVGTVSSQISRLREELRERLGDDDTKRGEAP